MPCTTERHICEPCDLEVPADSDVATLALELKTAWEIVSQRQRDLLALKRTDRINRDTIVRYSWYMYAFNKIAKLDDLPPAALGYITEANKAVADFEARIEAARKLCEKTP